MCYCYSTANLTALQNWLRDTYVNCAGMSQKYHLLQAEPEVLRNSANSRKRSAPLVPPTLTLSESAKTWLDGLGICADHVKALGAGMADVQHPDPAQGQVGSRGLQGYQH